MSRHQTNLLNAFGDSTVTDEPEVFYFMAKRFTDTNKWRDKWFRGLTPIEKILFLYLTDNCDNAGFIEVDYDLWAYQIGLNEDEIKYAFKSLKKNCEIVGEWCWITSFLHHQNNLPLKETNNAHKQIISLLKSKFNYFRNSIKFKEFLGANEGLFSPPSNSKGNGNSKGNVKDSVLDSKIWIEDICMKKSLEYDKCKVYLGTFLDDLELKGELDKGEEKIKSHFVNWLNIEMKKPVVNKSKKPTDNLAF